MYFHLGQDYILNDRDVIGIFDMDTTTVSARTRKFLRLAESEGAVIDLGASCPKASSSPIGPARPRCTPARSLR